MGQPYVGEIRIFAGNFAPAGWAFCDGQLMPIAENDVLFTLIGTTYGGDGQETFALPDLRGRVPVHMGQGPGISAYYQQGQMAGVESVTLSTQQIPTHTHTPAGSFNAGTLTDPNNGVWAASALNGYGTSAPDTNLSPQAVGPVGGSQPHDNMPPYLTVSFIISLFGIFPSQF
ncbi:MAG: tail fiber protein [Myxococcota bacterium]|nr:tail fiber protein [Myxococcota bacterium]